MSRNLAPLVLQTRHASGIQKMWLPLDVRNAAGVETELTPVRVLTGGPLPGGDSMSLGGMFRTEPECFKAPGGDMLSMRWWKRRHRDMYVHYWRGDLRQVYCYLVLTPVK